MRGFEYQQLDRLDGTNGTGVDWFKKWLEKDSTYSPQTYQQLATHLRGAGQTWAASQILFAGRERERENATGFGRVGLTLLRGLIGYGYGLYNLFALLWTVALVAFGTALLRCTGARVGFWYSVDMIIPVIHLSAAHYVEGKVQLGRLTGYYFLMHQLMGYVLAIFVLAGLAGLTR